MPMAPPIAAAAESRSSTCGHVRFGMTASTLWKCNGDRLLLELADLGDSGFCEREQLVERLTRERIALRRRLHLDQASVAGHDDVHVGVGVRVLGVVEVEPRH